jgi:hypothetical protein
MKDAPARVHGRSRERGGVASLTIPPNLLVLADEVIE